MLGNLVVLVPMLLNAHAGTKYGIPFPVLGLRGVAVVPDSNLDARKGDSLPAPVPVAGRIVAIGGLGLFWRFLAAEHAGDLAARRNHPLS